MSDYSKAEAAYHNAEKWVDVVTNVNTDLIVKWTIILLNRSKNPTAKNYNHSDHNNTNFPTVICHPLIFDYFGVALIVMLASGLGQPNGT